MMARDRQMKENAKKLASAYDDIQEDYLDILNVTLGSASILTVGIEVAPNDKMAVDRVLAIAAAGASFDARDIFKGHRNGGAALAVYDTYLCFYMYKTFTLDLRARVNRKVILPLSAVNLVKIKKPFFGVEQLAIFFTLNQKEYRLGMMVQPQGDSAMLLIDYFKHHHLCTGNSF